jgi:hypothetical protein
MAGKGFGVLAHAGALEGLGVWICCRVKAAATVVELLEESGLPPVCVSIAVEEDQRALLGSVLAEAVKVSGGCPSLDVDYVSHTAGPARCVHRPRGGIRSLVRCNGWASRMSATRPASVCLSVCRHAGTTEPEEPGKAAVGGERACGFQAAQCGGAGGSDGATAHGGGHRLAWLASFSPPPP